MKLNYNESELRAGLIGMAEKLSEDQENNITRLTGVLESFTRPESKAELHKLVAEENGISVDTLVSSPNYDRFLKEYRDGLAKKLIEALKVEFGFTDLEASAAVYFAAQM